MRAIVGFVATVLLATTVLPVRAHELPEQVSFPSFDGNTTLTGYLFRPFGARAGRRPAIVMMHGRGGSYSTAAQGRYDASTLSKRHVFWGRLWAQEGYAALLVDGFGSRGFPGGFPIHSYASRPDEVNEVTVRPLDAYAALQYLRSRPDIDARRIALQGWSNGGSATIVSLSQELLAEIKLSPTDAFLGGVAFYPACRLHDRFAGGYRPYAPLRIHSGDADEEVSTQTCADLIASSAANGSRARIEIYPGATHGFDDPAPKRQRLPANANATRRAVSATRDFIGKLFAP